MNRISPRLLVAILLLLPMVGWTQENPAAAPIQQATFGQLSTALNTADSHTFDGKIWGHLEFSRVPTDQEKNRLIEAQVNLYQYQPDLRWFASLPQDISPALLAKCGVARIVTQTDQPKIDYRVIRHQVPEHAKDGASVKAALVVASTGQYASMITELERVGITVKSTFAPLGILQVTGSEQALIDASQLPFVIYVELPEPPAEMEIEDEMTNTRGAFINGYYNLNGVNGNGVTIAVNEGGIVDTLNSPDFKNRLDRSLETGTVSGHKTGVSWRMGSAGNINPTLRGQAWGANLVSGGINFTNAAAANISIVSNSFGYGCIPAGPTYNTGAATNDFLVRTNSRFMVTYSCGNMGNSSCANYGAGQGWGNITGLTKSGKNIFAVGSMNTNDELTGFSSRGPAMDGRILPDITACGPGGTSHATPNLAGVNALLTESYRNANLNQWPNSGLIKAIILNTADDIENPGPDYKTGFGRINARQAKEVIDNGQFLTNLVSNAAISTNTITVPANVKHLKVTLYWTDREATPGLMGKTLVNDLDLRVQSPGLAWVQPWVLNPFPDPDSLDAFAVQATDTLNNVELVTIDNPVPGNYTVEVNGSLVPFGPQSYHIIYSFVYDSITVIYPHGGEGLVPGETRRIRWDAWDSGNTFDLEFSSDSGTTWMPIASGLASDLRSYTWTVPNTLSGNCLIKVKAGTKEAISDQRFTISPTPTNLNMVWRCADSVLFSWDSVPGALGYRAYRLGNKYMDTAAFSLTPFVMLHNLSTTATEWLSVQAVLPDSGSSRRAIAIAINPGDFNCIGHDLSVVQSLSPQPGYYPSCLYANSLDLTMRLKNTGSATLSYLPVAYSTNGGPISHDTLFQSLSSGAETTFTAPASIALQVGANTVKLWSTYPGDANPTNDTLEIAIIGYAGPSATLPFSQSFDGFTNCATSWGCSSIICSLSQGWSNLPNQSNADSIDWRTSNGTTGSSGTGPSGDHTSGNGKYLYLEGSGNSGSGCQNSEAQLHSPCFDLTGTNSPMLSYWYHANGNAIGSLHIDVLADGIWHLDVAPSVVGQQGNQWLQQLADLSAFSGKKVMVRFRGRTGNGFLSDLAIDDINLTTLPLAGFQTSMDTFCLGQTVQLQNLSSYGISYSWTISQNTFTYTSGNANSSNPTILPNDTGWYSVQLVATNASGSDTMLTTQFFYVGDFTPTVVANASGNTYCFGESATFTANGIGTSFQFFHNGVLVQSGSSITWNTTGLADGDSVWVETVVNSQCSFTSSAVTVTVQPDLDGTPLWADDLDWTICAGDTVLFAAQHGFAQYEFFIGSTSTQLGPDSLFEIDQLQDGDEVVVEVTDSVGCIGWTDTLLWTVYPIPPTPTVVPLGNDSLQASTLAGSYQWWNNGQLLTDTLQIIVAQGSGTFTVQAIDSGCASELSNGFNHTLVGIAPLVDGGIRLFPNPTRGSAHLVVEGPGFNEVKIFDETGRLIMTQEITPGMNQLGMSHLAAGLYIVKVSGEAGNRELKLLVK